MKNWINKIKKKITVKKSVSQIDSSTDKISESENTASLLQNQKDLKIKESTNLKLNEKEENYESNEEETESSNSMVEEDGENQKKKEELTQQSREKRS